MRGPENGPTQMPTLPPARHRLGAANEDTSRVVSAILHWHWLVAAAHRGQWQPPLRVAIRVHSGQKAIRYGLATAVTMKYHDVTEIVLICYSSGLL